MKFAFAVLLLSAAAVSAVLVQEAEELPVGFGGVPGLVWENIHKVPASGDFVGTKQSEGTHVLTNKDGGAARLVSPRPIHVNGFYYSNPNAETPLTITITAQPSGQVTVLNLLPDQGPTFVGPFHRVSSLEFVPSVPEGGNRKLLAAATSFALDSVSVALATSAPPPAVTPTATPTKAPTVIPPTTAPTVIPPTAAPTVITPTAAPTTPTAAPTPSATPTAAPSKAPTKKTPTKKKPTKCPLPARCEDEAEYRGSCGCKKCVTRSSPFKQFVGAGTLCYPPTTLSARSVVCTPAVLPAFIRSNIDIRNTVRCINPKKSKIVITLPVKNANIRYLSGKSYVDSSIRLDGTLKPVRGKARVFQGFNNRVEYEFEDVHKKLLSKPHKVVQLTGVVARPGDLLDFCFVAYVRVC